MKKNNSNKMASSSVSTNSNLSKKNWTKFSPYFLSSITLKHRVVKLEEEKQGMTECLQFMQEDLNELRAKVESTTVIKLTRSKQTA